MTNGVAPLHRRQLLAVFYRKRRADTARHETTMEIMEAAEEFA